MWSSFDWKIFRKSETRIIKNEISFKISKVTRAKIKCKRLVVMIKKSYILPYKWTSPCYKFPAICATQIKAYIIAKGFCDINKSRTLFKDVLANINGGMH